MSPIITRTLCSFKQMMTLVSDGNFKQNHLGKAAKATSIAPLMDGASFTQPLVGTFGEATRYVKHMDEQSGRKRGKPTKEVKHVCNSHTAWLSASAGKPHYDINGIGATLCARQGCYIPTSVVDFPRGEKYVFAWFQFDSLDKLYNSQASMDFSLDAAIQYIGKTNPNPLHRQDILTMYDINCQYGVYHQQRVDNSTHLFGIPQDITFMRGIGSFHIHAHQRACYPLFSSTFMQGAGNQAGEIVESAWSTFNGKADRCRTATHANRGRIQNAHMYDHNWKKLTKCGACYLPLSMLSSSV